jgi:NTP pyrophosphatase (non-canonical NTP hydrolase)
MSHHRQASARALGLHDSLAGFAQIMEEKLRANSHKMGWRNCTMAYLIRRIGQESAELRRAIKNGRPHAEVAREAADVANFCMMIADVYEPPVKP